MRLYLTPPSRFEQGQRIKHIGRGGSRNSSRRRRRRSSTWLSGVGPPLLTRCSLELSTGSVCTIRGGGSEPSRPWKMQTEDMEVPIINNLNDNGDRQRPKGKDVFKDQQKESEVNSSTAQRAPTAPGTGAHWTAVCAYVCVCVCCCWEAFGSAECPFHAASRLCSRACMRADGEVLFWQRLL